MKTLYCWNNDEQRVELFSVTECGPNKVPEAVFHRYCVDAFNTVPYFQNGMYIRHKEGKEWIPIPLKSFPKAFQAYLLLLS